MKTITHRGALSETVTLEFTNGYSLTLEAGLDMALFVAVDKPVDPKPGNDELLQLAQEVAYDYRDTSWSTGSIRKLIQYIDGL